MNLIPRKFISPRCLITNKLHNSVSVTMTPGWPCNKPDLTMKETTLYSAAMTPGKHGPHKYP